MFQPGLQRISIFMILLAFLSPAAAAMLNPAAVYCDATGNRYVTESTPYGDFGYCTFPDGTKTDAWEFFAGTKGEQHGACAKAGYRQETSSDPALCPFSRCAVCVVPGGKSVAAAGLLNLSYTETSCRDRTCGSGEDAISCPADCPSGDWDHLCDGIRDSRCDPDCPDGAGDPDCMAAPDYRVITGIAVIVIAGIVAILFLRKKKGTD